MQQSKTCDPLYDKYQYKVTFLADICQSLNKLNKNLQGSHSIVHKNVSRSQEILHNIHFLI